VHLDRAPCTGREGPLGGGQNATIAAWPRIGRMPSAMIWPSSV
jgi:hypothetical protein